jgi:hypothetical protein
MSTTHYSHQNTDLTQDTVYEVCHPVDTDFWRALRYAYVWAQYGWGGGGPREFFVRLKTTTLGSGRALERWYV